MHIQVNSGNSVAVDAELIATAKAVMNRTLARFEDRLTRLEVHVNDLNSERGGSHDKRCQIEARPAGLDPVSASHDAADIDSALRGAAEKMERLLTTVFGRIADRRPG